MKRSIRKLRIRAKINGTKERPRVVVFRSNKNLYLQAIDDVSGNTIASSSDLKSKNPAEDLAKQLLSQKISATGRSASGGKKIVFDRAGYQYHGKIKKIAEQLRASGLEF